MEFDIVDKIGSLFNGNVSEKKHKTVLVEYILNIMLDKEKIDAIYVFSKTCKLGENWKTIPNQYKFDAIDYEKIYKIIDYQKDKVDKQNKKKVVVINDEDDDYDTPSKNS